MLDTPEPRRCAGCGTAAGDRQTLRRATPKRPALTAVVVLHDTRIADWSRPLCGKCRTHAARLSDRLAEQRLTT